MTVRNDDAQALGTSAKDRRKRHRAALGIALIVLALVTALGAATLLTRYMDARVSAARVPTEKVVVARLDIPVASPLEPGWLEAIEWPSTARPTGSVSDPAALVGRVATAPIMKGEAVLASRLVSAGARSGLATLVPGGLRAAAVRVDDVVGVAGFIHPGDHVDVIVTMKPRDEAPFKAKVILQDVKVLAVGKDLEAKGKDGDRATPVTVATLMVSSQESERLALAASKGQLLLTLRGVGDDDVVATDGVVPPVLLASVEPPPPAIVARPEKRPARASPPRPAPPAEKQVVEILRGDLFEKRDFAASEKRR